MGSPALFRRAFIHLLLRARYADRIPLLAVLDSHAALQSITLGSLSGRRNNPLDVVMPLGRYRENAHAPINRYVPHFSFRF